MPPRKKRDNGLKPISLPRLPDRPLVSVLVANYNYAAYLTEAIESVLRQTYGNFELIICDDGSTDNSHTILDRYRSTDSRVRAIFQENAGQAAALSAAFRTSSGEIICLMDSDDVYSPEKLECMVEAFAASPSAGFVVHRMVRVDGCRQRLLGEIPLAFDLPSGWLGADAPLDALWMPPGMPPCSALSLRRVVADRIFPLPVGLRAFADTIVQTIAPLITPIFAINCSLGEYRIHGGNAGGVSSFTEAHLRRLVSFDNEIWKARRSYLLSVLSPPVGKSLLPPEPPSMQTAYAYARFRNDPAAKEIYRAFTEGPQFLGLPRLYRAYWKISAWLPSRVFRKSFDFVYGQHPAKLASARALRNFRRLRNVSHASHGTNKEVCPKTSKRIGV